MDRIDIIFNFYISHMLYLSNIYIIFYERLIINYINIIYNLQL